jgi:hypothetical protein
MKYCEHSNSNTISFILGASKAAHACTAAMDATLDRAVLGTTAEAERRMGTGGGKGGAGREIGRGWWVVVVG